MHNTIVMRTYNCKLVQVQNFTLCALQYPVQAAGAQYKLYYRLPTECTCTSLPLHYQFAHLVATTNRTRVCIPLYRHDCNWGPVQLYAYRYEYEYASRYNCMHTGKIVFRDGI